MLDQTVDRLRGLRETISRASGETVPDEVWSQVEAIEAELANDLNSSEPERQLVLQISTGISNLLRALRTGKNVDAGSIRVAIDALESSVKGREA
jgi:actin-like ATPase involved in cell morphogenesis